MKSLGLAILLLLVCVALITILRAPLISYFAFVPSSLTQMPVQNLYGAEIVEIQTEDGLRLQGLFFSVENTDSNVAARLSSKVVLYLHGNAGNLYSRVDAAHLLRQQGVDVLLIDYRGYGFSEGTISETGFYRDAMAARLWLVNVKAYAPSNIVVLGRSIGSVAALKLAVDAEVSAVILVSPIASAAAMASTMGMGLLAPLASGALDNTALARRLQKPLLVVHGERDEMVPIAQGREVFAAVLNHRNKRFITVKGANHHNIRQIAGEDYW